MALDQNLKERLRNSCAEALITSAEEAAKLIKDNMVVGVSGFTPSGYPKAVPVALAERANNGDRFQIDLYSGASLGPEIDTMMTEAGIIRTRLPYHTNASVRKAINSGQMKYIDMHLSQSPQYVNMKWQ